MASGHVSLFLMFAATPQILGCDMACELVYYRKHPRRLRRRQQSVVMEGDAGGPVGLHIRYER